MIHYKIPVILVALLLSGLSLNVTAADKLSSRLRIKQLIIQFRDGDTRQIQSVRRDQALPDLALPDGGQLKFLRRFDANGAVVQLPESLTPEQALNVAGQLAAQPGIASVVPDKRFFPAYVPNDPAYLPGSDAVHDPGQWHLFEDTAGIRMPAAWDRSTGSASTVVAILDTGILPHQDLDDARVLPGYDFYSNASLDNDGTPGRDDDPSDPGDAVDADECGAGEPAEDSSWHGLSVAGVIAAQSDNGTDIAGINFNTRVLPIRVLGKCGGDLSDVADAIRWAVGLKVIGVPVNPNPADVINLSLSGTGACSAQEQDAINAAVSRGATVVVAAGNEGGSVLDVSPANCNNVVVVGAIARDGRIASYVNVGSAVDIVAPGGDDPDPADLDNNPPNGVLTLSNFGTTVPGADALASIQGTSFTAAQVSAVVSLMLAVDGSLTPAMIEDIIKTTARAFPDPSCDTDLCGAGVLDADAALAGAADPTSVLGTRVNTSGSGGGCTVAAAGARFPDPVWLLTIAAIWGVRRAAG